MFDRSVRQILTLSTIVLLCVGASSCGGTSTPSKTVSTATEPKEPKFDADHDTDGAHPDEDERTTPPPDRDNDGDSTGRGRYDSDDSSVLELGHAASPSQLRQITALVRRYYAAADEENGTEVCALLYSTYAEAVPEDYGRSPPGPAYARGTTCPVVMSLVFKHFHDQVAARYPKLKIVRVRLKERQGVAILSFGSSLSEREVRLAREGQTWRVLALIDTELP